MTGNPALNVVLVEVGQDQREVLRQACIAAGYSPVFKTSHDACTDRLDRWADVVVVESDLGFRALRSAEKARRAGTPPVGVLVNWWSDLERDAREAADFVLHVPLTSDEIRDVLVSAIPMRTTDALTSALPDVVPAAQAIAAAAAPLPALGFR
jgi:CheY-like chemotaxis protein